MKRLLPLCCVAVLIGHVSNASSDVVLEWNQVIRDVIQADGMNPVNQANPGWSTRALAMMNGAIYDAHQSVNRTHSPYLYNSYAPSQTSVHAAVHEAAKNVLLHTYPGQATMITDAYDAKMALIPNNITRTNGVTLGSAIANAYTTARTGDGSNVMVPYTPGTLPGQWRPDPWNPTQQAWGPEWRGVTPFAIPASAPFVAALPPIPALDSTAYADAYNQVKDYGDLNSSVRTAEQTRIGLFWGYDHGGLGPPPVLFNQNVAEIAVQAGNTPEENARLFAQASVAQADACISAWDAKFQYNFWRPVTAIQEGNTDGNSATIEDPSWKPLGAPGPDPNTDTDDFTPPFPAWTSGHATMGGAVFKSLELFYGTNLFDEIDGILGNDSDFTLTSDEPNSGGARDYVRFTQTGPLAIDAEDSPEGENGMSRIYLGIHWIFDQQDGISLGNNVAGYVNSNYFQPVPEPSSLALIITGLAGLAFAARRRSR